MATLLNDSEELEELEEQKDLVSDLTSMDIGSTAMDFGQLQTYSEVLDAMQMREKSRHDPTGHKRAKFARDVEVVNQRLRARRGFANPRSLWVQYWDLATALALLYTATVTPFEVCLGMKTQMGALLMVNQLVNLIFIVDIFVQFVMPVFDKHTGEMIRSHSMLARRYLTSWFTIDVGTCLPFDLVMLFAPSLFEVDCGSGSGFLVKATKLLRTLRLFKLVRMMRASRLIQRWESSISVSTSTQTLIQAWIIWTVAMHWLACVWCILPQFQSSWRDDPKLAEAVRDKYSTARSPRLPLSHLNTHATSNRTIY